jgi:hypothetical protein
VDWLNKLGDSAFWPRQLDLLKDDPYLIAVIVVGAVIGWLVRKLWDQRQINILKATSAKFVEQRSPVFLPLHLRWPL